MKNINEKNTKVIAFIGTVLIWIPILFTLITAVVGSIASGTLRIDYLMPAELFPLAFSGALLLLWASGRSGKYKRPIGWSLAIMAGSLVASQGAAVLTGLASGETEAAGWPLFLVVSLLILYIAAVITQCIFGVLLLRRLNQKV
ncbi:MAG: hypothetical protein ABFD25_09430 [Clostridiaceae bacterium]